MGRGQDRQRDCKVDPASQRGESAGDERKDRPSNGSPRGERAGDVREDFDVKKYLRGKTGPGGIDPEAAPGRLAAQRGKTDRTKNPRGQRRREERGGNQAV